MSSIFNFLGVGVGKPLTIVENNNLYMTVKEGNAESLVNKLTTLDFLELRGKPGRLISLSVVPEHDQMIDLQRSMCLYLCKFGHCKKEAQIQSCISSESIDLVYITEFRRCKRDFDFSIHFYFQ